MKKAKLSNVPITDLLIVLSKLAADCDEVDIIIDVDNRKIIFDPIDKIQDYPELNNDNIYKII